MNNCIDIKTMMELAQGERVLEKNSGLAKHLEHCQDCQEQFEDIQCFYGAETKMEDTLKQELHRSLTLASVKYQVKTKTLGAIESLGQRLRGLLPSPNLGLNAGMGWSQSSSSASTILMEQSSLGLAAKLGTVSLLVLMLLVPYISYQQNGMEGVAMEQESIQEMKIVKNFNHRQDYLLPGLRNSPLETVSFFEEPAIKSANYRFYPDLYS